jgi:hypothetical protein
MKTGTDIRGRAMNSHANLSSMGGQSCSSRKAAEAHKAKVSITVSAIMRIPLLV